MGDSGAGGRIRKLDTTGHLGHDEWVAPPGTSIRSALEANLRIRRALRISSGERSWQTHRGIFAVLTSTPESGAAVRSGGIRAVPVGTICRVHLRLRRLPPVNALA